jgi:Flp pilus assembly protein TadG
MISPRRAVRSERGAELIEFALVFPLLLFVVLGIIDFGFLFQRMEVVTNAAREGARVAVLPGYDSADVRTRVCDYLLAGGVPVNQGTCVAGTDSVVAVDDDFDIAVSGGTVSGKQVVVTFSHTYTFISGIAGWFGGAFSSVPVRGVAVMRDEVQSGS